MRAVTQCPSAFFSPNHKQREWKSSQGKQSKQLQPLGFKSLRDVVTILTETPTHCSRRQFLWIDSKPTGTAYIDT
jgi:hypothetical protein